MGEEGKIQFTDWKRAMLSYTAQGNRRKILNHFWRSLGLWEAAHLQFFNLEENMVLQFVSYFLKIHFTQLKTAKQEVTLKKAISANTSLWHWAASASAASAPPTTFITHCIIQTKPQKNKDRKSQKAAPHLILFMDCNTHSRQEPFCTSPASRAKKSCIKIKQPLKFNNSAWRKNAVLPRLMHKTRSSSTGDLNKTAKHDSYNCSPTTSSPLWARRSPFHSTRRYSSST